MNKPRATFDPVIAGRLKSLRLEKGLTVYVVAETFGITASTISRYETASISPNKGIMEKYAQFFNVSPLWILGLSEEREYSPRPYGVEIPLLGTFSPGVPIPKQTDVLETLFASSALKPLFCWKMPDQSMMGARIGPDDMICISAYDGLESGTLYAIQYDGGLLIRRILVAGTSMILHPENSNFADIIITMHEKSTMKIIGRVISVAHWVG